jgi:hypothetical protein
MNTSTIPLKMIEMINPQPSFRSILYRTIISHTVTYFVTGVVASILLGYATRMIRPDVAPIIRKITDPILMASPFVEKRFRQKEGTNEKNIGVHNHFDGADCLHNAPEAGDN